MQLDAVAAGAFRGRVPGPGLVFAQLAPQQVRDHLALELRTVAAGFPQLAAAAEVGHGTLGGGPPRIPGDPAGDPAFAVAGLPDDLGLDDLAGEEGQGRLQQEQAPILGPADTLAAPGETLDGSPPTFSSCWGIPICWRNPSLFGA